MNMFLKGTIFCITVLSVVSLYPGSKTINSLLCSEKIPGVKEILADSEKSRKTKTDELQKLEIEYKNLKKEMERLYAELSGGKSSLMDTSPAKNQQDALKTKERKSKEMEASGQRLMQDLQMEGEELKMALQPYIMEAIQTAQEVAKNDPTIDLVFDLFTGQIIYSKESSDMSGEVMKLTEKKNENKAALAKNKAPKAPATKAA